MAFSESAGLGVAQAAVAGACAAIRTDAVKAVEVAGVERDHALRLYENWDQKADDAIRQFLEALLPAQWLRFGPEDAPFLLDPPGSPSHIDAAKTNPAPAIAPIRGRCDL